MPFGLPPAWNPGFALPDNVKDEGLERRGLVTKQMPRGTYDDPSVGTGGYVVPQYVLDEGIGQGAIGTKWMRRGTYGPRVPQWIQRQPTVVAQRSVPGRRGGRGSNVVTIQRRHFGNPNAVAGLGALGAISGEPPLPEPFEQYGARAANAILSRINQLAPGHRKQQLKKLLDTIDPSLWNRTAEITRRYVGQGLHATEAFPRGLARALAAGIAAEMITTGQSRRAPQANSLLGLGCYGCNAALGATSTTALGPMFQGALQTALKATATPITPKFLQVGPFTFPYDTNPTGYAVQFNSPAELARIPEAQKAFIRNMLLKGAGDNGPWHIMTPATSLMPNGQPFPGHREMVPFLQVLGLGPNPKIAGEMIWGADPHAHGISGNSIADHKLSPIVTFERPWNLSPAELARLQMGGIKLRPDQMQTNWGIFLSFTGKAFYIWYNYIPDEGWWHGLGRFVLHLAATVSSVVPATIGLVEGALKELGSLACDLANSSGAVAAGAGAGMAVGGPGGAQAGAAGANIAKGLCGGKAPAPPPMPPPPPPTNLLPYILIGGGALAAIILLKKKKASP